MVAGWSGLTPAQRRWRLYHALVVWSRVCRDEVCGLLYPDGPHIVRNISERPDAYYIMDPAGQVALMKERGWPEVVFHTHPRNTHTPSSIDHAHALPGVPYAIGCPDGWAGLWLDGEQIGDAQMTATNDIVELYEDGGDKWRWRRIAPNGATISGSEESFDSKSNAARAAKRANPDCYDNPATSEGPTVGDPNAGVTAGTTASGATGPATTGGTGGTTQGGSDSSGVGPTGGVTP